MSKTPQQEPKWRERHMKKNNNNNGDNNRKLCHNMQATCIDTIKQYENMKIDITDQCTHSRFHAFFLSTVLALHGNYIIIKVNYLFCFHFCFLRLIDVNRWKWINSRELTFVCQIIVYFIWNFIFNIFFFLILAHLI